MYFRTKTIKGTPLVQLVQSYRNEEGQPRQRVVASLGKLHIPEDQKRLIARAVEMRLQGGQDLFESELSEEAAAWVARIVPLAGRSKGASVSVKNTCIDGVLLDEIETENVVQLGPQLVALKAWDALGFTPMLEALGMNASRIATAQLMISNRLIKPLSEWALIDWAHRTALPELLGTRIAKTTKDRLYHTSDKLLSHRKTIETHLREHEKNLFSLSRSIILYDVTNTHFEGICQSNPKARHGKNKQKRNDCRQVAIGVAFDEHGLPLAHETFEGNVADTKTLCILLDRLALTDDELGLLKPVVILDAGFASKANIAMLKKRGYSYLINITRGSRTKYAESFEKEVFEALPGRKPELKVEVKKITDPEDEESQLLLCRSTQRRLKEEAMLSKAEARFLIDAHSLRERIEKGKLKTPGVIERKIGALLKKHPRVRRFYKVQLQEGGLDIERIDKKMDEAQGLCGDYVLKTDKSLGAAELWGLYMTLLKAEAGFKMLKGSLGLRPNFHQLEDRVDGHIFISVLAYHLLSWLRHHLERSGDVREWKTIRRLLSTHSLVSTRLELEDGRIITIRKASVPDPEQALVYKELGIDWRAMCPPVKTEMK
jgi:transposase